MYGRPECRNRYYMYIVAYMVADGRQWSIQTLKEIKHSVKLRHSAPHFQPNSGGIAYWVAELKSALNLDTRAKKMEK